MGKTAFTGPILGNADSGAFGFPIELVNQTRYLTYFNDFKLEDSAETTDYPTGQMWSETNFTAGAAAIDRTSTKTADASTGFLRLDCPGSNQGLVTQLDFSTPVGGAAFGYIGADGTAGSTVDTECWFASRFRIQDVSASAIFVGLAELQGTSAVLSASASTLTTSDNHAGFHQINSDNGALRFTSAGTADTSGSSTTSVVTVADGEWVEVAFRLAGGNKFWAYVRTEGQASKWNQVASGTNTSAWDEQMVITLGNVGAGSGDDLDVDYVAMSMKRDIAA